MGRWGWACTDRDREEPPGHLYHGGTAEVAGEERDVDGGRHEDDLEVWPLGQQAPEDTQEEVVVQVPLVDLIHNQDLVLGQAGLPLQVPQEQPHRQKHDLGGRRTRALEADLVADLWGGGGWSGEDPGPGHQHLALRRWKPKPVPPHQTRQSNSRGWETHFCYLVPQTLDKQFYPSETYISPRCCGNYMC